MKNNVYFRDGFVCSLTVFKASDSMPHAFGDDDTYN